MRIVIKRQFGFGIEILEKIAFWYVMGLDDPKRMFFTNIDLIVIR
jgi:hypothetical protein